jgi:replicative DNA helicase
MDTVLEREVVSTLLSDEDAIKEVFELLKPEHISSPHLKWMLKGLYNYHKKYKERPPLQFFIRRIEKSKKLDTDEKERYAKLTRKLFKNKKSKGFKKYTIDELKEFVNTRELAKLIERGLTHLESGEIEKTISTLTAANKVKAYQNEYIVCDWLNTLDDRQKERKQRKLHPERSRFIKLPWHGLNKVIGGLQPGEVAGFASLTNIGKSIILMLCGKQAVLDQKNVIHFTGENSLWQTNQRYDAAMFGIAYDKFKFYRFKKAELKQLRQMAKDTRKLFGSRLRTVKFIPRRASIITLERVIEELYVNEGFKADLIVIDSADHLVPAMKQEQFRLDQSEIYWDVKTLGAAHDIPIITSTQVAKTWRGKKAAAESLAEAYDKARILDIVITINQLDEDSQDLIMLLAKNRDGKRNVEFPMVAEYGNMSIKERI